MSALLNRINEHINKMINANWHFWIRCAKEISTFAKQCKRNRAIGELRRRNLLSLVDKKVSELKCLCDAFECFLQAHSNNHITKYGRRAFRHLSKAYTEMIDVLNILSAGVIRY